MDMDLLNLKTRETQKMLFMHWMGQEWALSF